MIFFQHHKVFFYIAIVWGLCMVFLTPPFMVPDEPAHFYRAYQISEGHFIPDVNQNRLGGDLPNSLSDMQNEVFKTAELKMDLDQISSLLNIQLHPEIRAFLFFPNTSLYTPIPYIPQSIGIGLGRLINAPPLILLYLARLFNLIFWIFLSYHSLKLIPFYKNLLFVLLLLPMSVYQAASASADVVLNALSFFLISMAFKWYSEKDKQITYRDIILLLGLSMAITWSKSIYFLLIALLLIIPQSRFVHKKTYWLSSFLVMLVTVVAFAVNYEIVQYLLSQIHPIENIYGINGEAPRINPDLQLKGVLNKLPEFIILIFRSLWHYKFMVLQSYIGVFGWMNIAFNNYYYLLIYIIIVGLAIFDNQYNIQLTLKIKVLLFLLASGILMLFSITMYLSWNNVGDAMIDNWQGRYFIPVTPLVLFLFFQKKKSLLNQYLPLMSLSVILLSLVVSISNLVNAFYL